MRAFLPALLAMLGLSRDVPVQAPEPSPVVDVAGDRAALAFLPRGGFPRRRAYGLPPGDWTTPFSYLRPSAELEIALASKREAKRVRRAERFRRDTVRTEMGRTLSAQRAQARQREFMDGVDRDFVRTANGWVLPVVPVPSSVRDSERRAVS